MSEAARQSESQSQPGQLDMGDTGPVIEIILDHFRKSDVKRGAEIGVHRGATSAVLLAEFPFLKLWMVDAWAEYSPDSEYRQSGDGCSKLTRTQQMENKRIAGVVTDFANSRRSIWQFDSVAAGYYYTELYLPRKYLDFALIDGDHTYPAVKLDIAAWWPNLRADGGVMLFHDYGHKRDRKGIWGVTRAVTEFAEREGLTVGVRGQVAWIVKGKSDGNLSD